MMLLMICQLMGTRVAVHCTWNRSFVGAYHSSKNPSLPPMLVNVTLLMAGNGLTTTANALVALKLGVPLSVTMVVRVLLVPDCAKSGVQVMTPLVLIVGRFVPAALLAKL